MQRRATPFAIEPIVFEHHIGGTKQLAGADAPARTPFAPHFEQIGEVIVEQQCQIEARRPVSMVL